MADKSLTIPNLPENEEQFGDPSAELSEEQFGDLPSNEKRASKLKRKNVPEIFVLQPNKQKIQEKRIKIDVNEPKIPHLKLPEAQKIENKENFVTSKPPLPPKKDIVQLKLKRKIEDDSTHQIQKLTATNEQLRLEITELKILLQNEKIVTRRLR